VKALYLLRFIDDEPTGAASWRARLARLDDRLQSIVEDARWCSSVLHTIMRVITPKSREFSMDFDEEHKGLCFSISDVKHNTCSLGIYEQPQYFVVTGLLFGGLRGFVLILSRVEPES
jgi:hypothetical protein